MSTRVAGQPAAVVGLAFVDDAAELRAEYCANTPDQRMELRGPTDDSRKSLREPAELRAENCAETPDQRKKLRDPRASFSSGSALNSQPASQRMGEDEGKAVRRAVGMVESLSVGLALALYRDHGPERFAANLAHVTRGGTRRVRGGVFVTAVREDYAGQEAAARAAVASMTDAEKEAAAKADAAAKAERARAAAAALDDERRARSEWSAAVGAVQDEELAAIVAHWAAHHWAIRAAAHPRHGRTPRAVASLPSVAAVPEFADAVRAAASGARRVVPSHPSE